MATRCLLIGVGNPDRGDDAIGPLVARAVRELAPPAVEVRELEGEGSAIFFALGDAQTVVIVDASRSGAPPGTVERIDAWEAALPASSSETSTHAFGLAAAIELARALGALPPRCILYGVEGASFRAGEALSPPVGRAIAALIPRLARELRELADAPEIAQGRAHM